jgi:hypothetical protein
MDDHPLGCVIGLAVAGVILIGFLFRIGWDMAGSIVW